MAWNEPGGGQRNPWRKNERTPYGKQGLDALLKALRARFGKLFKGSGGLPTIVLGLLVVWLMLSSYTVVGVAQAGVVLRLGAYARTLGPGFHFKWPSPFETVTRVDVARLRAVSDSTRLLTRDEDIVVVDFTVQYQVVDARKYLYATGDAEAVLHAAAAAAVRAMVASASLDDIMSGGSAYAAKARQVLAAALIAADTGVQVTDLSFQNIAPPAQVKDAFDDVENARQDRQASIDRAKAEAVKLAPQARTAAEQKNSDAQIYKIGRIAHAQGEVQRFDLVLAQYKAAPDITRRRLWLETMEDVLATNTTVVDGGGHAIVNLPARGSVVPAVAASVGDEPASMPAQGVTMPAAGDASKEKQP